MFRELTRKKQALSINEAKEILKTSKRGTLAVLGDEDYPYAVPINHYFDEESNKIYFHGGKNGHKIDSIIKHEKISYCVIDDGHQEEGNWHYDFKSVIVFGKAKIIDDYDEVISVCKKLSYQFTTDEAYIQDEIEHFGKATRCIELSIEHISGKIVHEK